MFPYSPLWWQHLTMLRGPNILQKIKTDNPLQIHAHKKDNEAYVNIKQATDRRAVPP